MSQVLHPGNTYTALVYDPKPSPAEMRAAGTAYPPEAARYVSFTLAGDAGAAHLIGPRYWSASGPSSIEHQVAGTPYEDMYALARRLAAGAATPYDAAHRIELYLRNNFEYRQDVPNRTYPLPAFLSEDQAGYCQQFSGTMALMLRMLGIPSRVAVGFSPGGRDPEHNNYLVDDTDAHNWVEVFFPGIGWTTFEPTPPTAPAATQIDDNTLGITDPALPDLSTSGGQGTDPTGADVPTPQRHRGLPTDLSPQSSGPPAGPILLGGLLVVALTALGGYAFRARRRSRLGPDELADAELRELEQALAKLGSPLPPGSTLRRAKKQLQRLAGPGAAPRYAEALEAYRYRDPDSAPPSASDRRAVRRALIKAPQSGSTLRALLAFPPGGPRAPSRRRERAGWRTSRSARRRRAGGGPSAAPG
jgi:transglutaminase-like putative cysteine protease